MTTMTRAAAAVFGGLLAAAAVGCGKDDVKSAVGESQTDSSVPGQANYAPNYAINDARFHAFGGPPNFGDPSGTGFSDGDAYHNGGQGSGLMGFNGNGYWGTTWAISDRHKQGPPNPSSPEQVLPEQ